MAESHGTKNSQTLNGCWSNEKLNGNPYGEETHWSGTEMATQILINISHGSWFSLQFKRKRMNLILSSELNVNFIDVGVNIFLFFILVWLRDWHKMIWMYLSTNLKNEFRVGSNKIHIISRGQDLHKWSSGIDHSWTLSSTYKGARMRVLLVYTIWPFMIISSRI